MAIFESTPPTKTLFHGSPRVLEGEYIHAKTRETCLCDTAGGPYAFAGICRDHALAYGLKDGRHHASFVGMVCNAPVVIIVGKSPAYWDTLRHRKTHVAEVKADTFKHGVFTRKPKHNEMPLEWVSCQSDAKIVDVKSFTNDQILQAGVQLIIADLPWDKIAHMDMMQKLRECLAEKHKERWINLQSEYRNAPPWLVKSIGIESSAASRDLRPSLG